MMRVLSDVYPPEIKPVRDGWYLARVVGGEFWLLVRFESGYWLNDVGMPMVGRPREWRGIAFSPDEATKASRWVPTDDADGWVSGVFVPGATCE